jgi:lipoprotein-releasing system permease protein
VMDKTKDIGVLRSLGARPASLMKIFAIDGLLIGFIGSTSGFLIGCGICWALKKYSFVDLPKEIYYVDRLPVKASASDVLAIIVVSMALSFLSALYPAIMAGKLDPVKALRYE